MPLAKGIRRVRIAATIRKLQPRTLSGLPLQLRAGLAGVAAEANRIKIATKGVQDDFLMASWLLRMRILK
jgi:hypothetical protein